MKDDARLPGAIDVHAHFLPPGYREACEGGAGVTPDGIPSIPAWSPDGALELMDRVGVRVAFLSISSPGVFFGDRAAAGALARSVNIAGAELVWANPSRFGLLASLPLPDLDASLGELAHAYDELHCDGIVLLTNYGGTYVGDDALEPLLAELDDREAVVLLHPSSPACWQTVSFGRPRPILEFPLDTTRTVLDLALSGGLTRHPRIRWIIPHAGGALPVLADRAHLMGAFFCPEGSPVIDVIAELGRLYYDLAGTPLPRALPALLTLVAPEQLLYGSDFPFTPAFAVEALAEALATSDVLSEVAREAMFAHNAARLFPRLQAMGDRATRARTKGRDG
ncbi:MAG TPA: amidohydrolase family protein [Solirubrobacteraceae bacterium]|nr:amidohydrolase family protein [Solirubrobacteraceae bacterium]